MLQSSHNACRGNTISTVDRNGLAYGVRLKRAREAAGKSPDQMASLVGVSVPAYYDWECAEGDINTTASLGELAKLSSALSVRTRAIFEDEGGDERPISPEQLCARIKAHLDATNMSIAEFEDRVGFVIEPALDDPSEVLKWNVDCLRFVCGEIGLDWRLALP
jgi:transcriptional regulator with XRE-family HTH domain